MVHSRVSQESNVKGSLEEMSFKVLCVYILWYRKLYYYMLDDDSLVCSMEPYDEKRY